jgi:alpha-glucosidase
MKSILSIFCTVFICGCISDADTILSEISSPDGKITASISSSFNNSFFRSNSTIQYSITLSGQTVIRSSPFGIIRSDQEFYKNLILVSKTDPVLHKEPYTLKSGKRLHCENYFREMIFTFANINKSHFQIVFRVYNDGCAFKYIFPENNSQLCTILKEETGFSLPTDSTSWVQPYNPVKPCYEESFLINSKTTISSPKDAGWCFPALFNNKGNWILITESGLDDKYCGSHLSESDNSGLYKIRFPEKKEIGSLTGEHPSSTLSWSLPWRVIIIGSQPSVVIESNLVQNVSSPCTVHDLSWIKPGHAIWSWWSQENSPADFAVQMRYIDYAIENNIQYVLIDEGWQSIPDNKLKEIISYAAGHNIGIFLWYHSGAGKPDNQFSTIRLQGERKKEFKRLQKIGVKGIKVDFFLSDKQPVIKLYTDILNDALQYKLMVNFHGSTIPRGWEKTYPNLMTMEAVRGSESFNDKVNTDSAPEQNTILPFTRNAVGSMDYTPLTFDLSTKGANKKTKDKPVRKTTNGHELALSVIFESGITHYADSIATYSKLPDYVRNFMGTVPSAWDETRFIDGKPGKYIVLARRKGPTWYIAGINGQNNLLSVKLKIPFTINHLEVITDGVTDNTFTHSTEKFVKNTFTITMKPHGGFSAVSR